MRKAVTLFLALAIKASCFSSTWILSGSGTWNIGTSWDTSPFFPNGIDDEAIIQQNIMATTPITLGQDITIGSLTIGDMMGFSSYQINPGNTLTFQSNSGTAVWNNTGGTFNNLACSVFLASSLSFQGTAGGIVTGQISGPGALIIDDLVSLLLDDSNTYTGGTFIHEGAINLQIDGGIPPGSTATVGTGLGPPLRAIIACPGGTVMTPANAFFANILSDGLVFMGSGAESGLCVTGVEGTGQLRFFSGVVTSFIQVTGTAGDTTFDGDMTGGVVSVSSDSMTGQRFLKSGPSRLTFSGPLSYDGRIFVQGGTLAIQNSTSLGAAASSATFVLSGASLELQNGIAVNKPISLNGAGVAGTGALFNASGSNSLTSSPLTLGWSDVLSSVVASDPTLGVATGTDLTISSIVQGTNGWTKSGGGTLILSAANTFTGTATVAEGTLLVNGSTLNIPLSVSSGAVLGGSGTIGAGGAAVVNNGTLSPGSSIGTLTIGGSFTQGAGGVFLEEVLSTSSFDLLIVNGGGVALDGNLTVQFLPGHSIQAGDQILFIDNTGGTGVIGNFSSVSTINVPSYLNPVSVNNGNHVLLQFVFEPEALFLQEIPNLSSPFFAIVDRQTFDLTRKLSYARRRIKPYASDGETSLIAQSDFPGKARPSCSGKLPHPWFLFADAIGTFGSVYKTATQNPFSYTSAGALAGGGYTFRQGALGIALDFDKLGGTIANSSGNFTLNALNASLFGTVLPTCLLDLYLDWVAGSGVQFYKLRRSVEDGSVSGSPGGWDAFGYTEAGYSWRGHFGTLTPLAGLEYAYLFIQKYNEKGESAFRLSVDSQEIHSLRSVLGATWGWEWVHSIKTLSLEIRSLWLREYLNGDRDVGFVSIPFGAAAQSTIQVLSSARNTYLAGGIFRLCLNKFFHFEASYDFEWSASFHTHFLLGGIEGRF